MNTVLKLFVVIVATSSTCFLGQTSHAESGRSGRPGMGGGHHRPGGHGGSSFRGNRGLVGPSTSVDLFGGGVGAGGFWGGGWGAWYPGYPNDPWGYETGRIPTPPYFAIHPPVYYGQRVGMPYGNSTVTRPPRAVFDMAPTTVQPVVHIRQPQMIRNPYVVDGTETAEEPTAAEPPKAERTRTKRADPPIVDKSRRKGKKEPSRKSPRASRNKRKAGKAEKSR
jgi:hypothetical protein